MELGMEQKQFVEASPVYKRIFFLLGNLNKCTIITNYNYELRGIV